VVASEPTSTGRRGPELRNTWYRRSSPLGEVEPGDKGHVATSELTSVGRRDPELRNTWQRRSSTQQVGDTRGHVTCDSTRAHLNKEVTFGATRHVAVPEPTPVGRCGPKLQFIWQRVNVRHAPYLDLELVCGVSGLQGADIIAG
jgi:hypothetical protein